MIELGEVGYDAALTTVYPTESVLVNRVGKPATLAAVRVTMRRVL